MGLRMHHSDPRYALWLRVRDILLNVLPEWFRMTFPAAVRCSHLAEDIVDAIGPGDGTDAQLARLRRRLARLEYRIRRVVEYKDGGGQRTTLTEELAAEYARFDRERCPFCGAGEEAVDGIVYDHADDCEVLR